MQDSAALLPSVSAHDEALRGFDARRLLAPEQALIAYFGAVAIAPCGRESVALEDAFGRVLATGAVAAEDHPSHSRSTMDGYAIASADTMERRRVVAEILMGAPAPRELRAGEALRIPTGGALPRGADAVVPQEDVVLAGDEIIVRESLAAGTNVTQRADDVRAGETVLAPGRRIGAPELGVLATLGYARVDVYVRPRVAILSTGDELVDPQGKPGPGQVRDSNRYAIAGALAAFGAAPVQIPRSADTLEALRRAVHAALESCDALVLTGGSSVGIRDLVPRVVAEFGPPGAVVHGLRVKPGKPTLLGAAGRKPIVGLPGNPTSALTILEAVARPIVLALTGEDLQPPATLTARASAPFAGRAGWTWYVPVRLYACEGALLAEPLMLRSAHTSLLARAAGYVVLGETSPSVAAGDLVPVYRFSAGGAPIASGAPGGVR
jgi:molybdenum cofactor synthesis domain-containing protein